MLTLMRVGCVEQLGYFSQFHTKRWRQKGTFTLAPAFTLHHPSCSLFRRLGTAELLCCVVFNICTIHKTSHTQVTKGTISIGPKHSPKYFCVFSVHLKSLCLEPRRTAGIRVCRKHSITRTRSYYQRLRCRVIFIPPS